MFCVRHGFADFLPFTLKLWNLKNVYVTTGNEKLTKRCSNGLFLLEQRMFQSEDLPYKLKYWRLLSPSTSLHHYRRRNFPFYTIFFFQNGIFRLRQVLDKKETCLKQKISLLPCVSVLDRFYSII